MKENLMRKETEPGCTERSCIDCGVLNCDTLDKMFPDFCPTAGIDEMFLRETMKLYTEDEENARITIKSAEVEAENYCAMTRIQEIVELAKKIGARRLGIATCVGLIGEARTAAKIFRSHGFEVYGTACKVGAQSKASVGIEMTEEDAKKVGGIMCNPILQAKLLNEKKTDLNIVIGLCVGHDSLFYKYSDALCTTLVTKDRVLGHNPVAALYQANTYYKNKLFGDAE